MSVFETQEIVCSASPKSGGIFSLCIIWNFCAIYQIITVNTLSPERCFVLVAGEKKISSLILYRPPLHYAVLSLERCSSRWLTVSIVICKKLTSRLGILPAEQQQLRMNGTFRSVPTFPPFSPPSAGGTVNSIRLSNLTGEALELHGSWSHSILTWIKNENRLFSASWLKELVRVFS